jgi:hypothetical protein
LIVIAVALAVFCVAAEYVVRHAEPILRASLVDALSARFHSPVQLDRLDISLARGLQVRGAGLRILYLAGPTQPDQQQARAASSGGPAAPMLSVQQFSFRASLADLLHLRAHIARLYVEGVQVHIPPHSLNGLLVEENPAHHTRQPRIALSVAMLLCKNVKVFLDTTQPGKDPIQIEIENVQLNGAGTNRSMLYVADIINPKPIGKVHAFGHFGPWQAADPRATPLDGVYTFQNADLSTIKGLGGTLSSTGHFTGQLGRVAVQGTTSTPDFSLDVSSHPEPLSTRFQADVDGTTGDTMLTHVDARLKHSAFVTSGMVKRMPLGNGHEGHDIALTVNMAHGRIEDLLQLGTRTSPPLMTGDVSLQATLHIPPGKAPVPAKTQLVGKVAIHGVEFNNAKLQDQVDGLSMRAQGKPREVKAAQNDRRPEVASEMQADVSLANALMTVHSLTYQIPGATVLLDGVYSLDGNVFEFKGHVRTQATASQMVTGWKSFLLKPVDPFLKKNGAGLELPIAISGTKGDVKVGLAMHDANESPGAMITDLKQRDRRTRQAAAAKALTEKADREDVAAAHEKDLAKAEQIHNQAVRDRAEAQRDAAAASPATPASPSR